jgi:RimJ/RimL family protein N-acetyltransferase
MSPDTAVAIRLIPVGEEHLAMIAALTQDPDVQRFARVPVPVPPDFAQTWLQRYETGRLDGSCEAFVAVDGRSGEVLGAGMAPHIDRATRTAELGYVVAPQARGRGVATEILRLLTEWGFSELGALRLELLISVDNVASKHVAARCGYVQEGVLRSLHVKQDVREDTEIWSCLPGDPR